MEQSPECILNALNTENTFKLVENVDNKYFLVKIFFQE